jgi:hypothetical protein
VPEKVWASLCSSALALLALLLLFSARVDFLGVALEGGRFVARQGFREASVSQEFGLFLYSLAYLALASNVAAGIMSLWILGLHGSLRPKDVLARDDLRPYEYCLKGAKWVLAATILYCLVTRS